MANINLNGTWLQRLIDQLATEHPELKTRLYNEASALCRCWTYDQSPHGPHSCCGGCPVHAPCWCEWQ
jgi:hypothetical protein